MFVQCPEPAIDAASAYVLADQHRMASARRYYEWQARLVRREIGSRVIEAGCGIGNFTARLLDREAIIAVDVDSAAIRQLESHYSAQPNIYPVTCDIAEPDFEELARFQPDSCVCLNVLEHIRDDEAALRHMASVLEPGGVVVLLLPAFNALYGPIDRNLGHWRRYRRRDVHELAASAGLQVRKAHYMNCAGFFAWWANARLFRREVHSQAQIRFFDRWIVPVLSRAEAVVQPPFGQSLFAVLVKP